MSKKIIRQKIYALLKTYVQSNRIKSFIPGKTKIQYAGAYYDEKELIAMVDVLLEGWFGLGIRGELLEQQLSQYIGSSSTLLTNSGSSASLLAMAGLTSDLFSEKVEHGAEVITPACTFATTVSAIVEKGLIPVFVDVDLDTYNVNPEIIEKAITKKTRILFLPHTLGNPFEVDRIIMLARKYKLHVVEDNCDGLGSEYNGKKTGSFGILATCSFYPAHHITLAGEGGAVFINDQRLDRVILALRNWGRGCWCSSEEKNPLGACGCRFDFTVDGIPVDHKYYFLTLGYNLKPVELQAAMGLIQLNRFPAMIAMRKKNFDTLYAFFKKYEDFFILPKSSKKASSCWFSFPLTIREGAAFTRRDITQYLENKGIETRTMFAANITRHPAMRRVRYRLGSDLKNSDKILRDSFFIGLWPGINAEMMDYTLSTINSFLDKKGH